MVIEDQHGHLLGAKIAQDGQWRFPAQPSVPEKFTKAILTFEDKRFFSHPGVDPLALARALRQNLRSQGVVSGGSTLTMQVIRLSRKGKPRSVFQKAIEIILATRLELGCSKEEILALYASYAPFGGNVVGIDAASWRYFGKVPASLTWAESATLAVLPNSPSLIHLGRNRDALRAKRNALLQRLFRLGEIDSTSFELALSEPLPGQPHPLPRLAPHLLARAEKESRRSGQSPNNRLRTTLDLNFQKKVSQIANRSITELQHNQIHNLAVLVIEVRTGNVLAYVGNVPTGPEHGEDVDLIMAPRSSGSILKPLLYCEMLQQGEILPKSLVPDIPTYIAGYRPENFNNTYDGVVSAEQALVRSLNVPFVKLLQQHGVEKFHFELNQLQLTTITRPPNDYGLTLILGGAETTLWDITNVYACMARRLGDFYRDNSKTSPAILKRASFLKVPSENPPAATSGAAPHFFDAGEIWLTFEAMKELNRPDEEGDWQRFETKQKIAWKTGTSFGFRDAWAIGVSPKYAVGVWVGNADGEGRPGLVGGRTAAPVLFEVFDLFPSSAWFETPFDDLEKSIACAESGYLPTSSCPRDTVLKPRNAILSKQCAYHEAIFLDETGTWRVAGNCYPVEQSKKTSWFRLPPTEAQFYKTKNPNYQLPPPLLPACRDQLLRSKSMELVYPKDLDAIVVPLELDGTLGRTVFEVAHQQENTTIYWHLDNQYFGSTKTFHSFEIAPEPGKHLLVLVDEMGERIERWFTVMPTKLPK